MLCVLWFQKIFAYRWWFLFSIKCFIECHKLSKNTCTRTWMYVNWWFWFFFTLNFSLCMHISTLTNSALPYICGKLIKLNLIWRKKEKNILHKANKFLCNRIRIDSKLFQHFLNKITTLTLYLTGWNEQNG